MATKNSLKNPPKGSVNMTITLTEEQKLAKAKILLHPVNFLIGQAGTGKTLVAVQIALDMFFKREIDQIIITRPTITSEDNGFLPGSLQEKMDPWLVPIRSNMRKVYNKPELLEKMEVSEEIMLVSLAHFRGRTFDNSICIVDEFQNLTKPQLQMCLGRLGKKSTLIFTGDKHQIDLKFPDHSAIHDIAKIENSKYVSKIILHENHRHESLNEIFKMLNEY
jgi:phosphate starvation-inducible protein PhoH and related proteins